MISYLTAIASAFAVIITFLTLRDINADLTNYTLLASMMVLMFGYSVVIVLLKPSSRKYSDILAESHFVIHEIRSLVTADDVTNDQIEWSISRILRRIQELFSNLSGRKCTATLMLIQDNEKLVRYSASEERTHFDFPIYELGAYRSLLEGEKYFLGDISDSDEGYYSDPKFRHRFRSLAVFPISKTETIKINERKRIVVGFLSIESVEANAFSENTSPGEEGILFKTGSFFSDSLALLIPQFVKISRETNSQQNVGGNE